MPLASLIAPNLPLLRRYARALSGSQAAGDALVAAMLTAIVDDPSLFDRTVAPRLALYRAFQRSWAAGADDNAAPSAAAPATSFEATANARLAAMTPRSRQALLLGAMEGFTVDDTAYLLDCDAATVRTLVEAALAEIARQTRAQVLIIEDEPIIAMHLDTIVRDLGHDITGIATTLTEALAQFHATPPGLVLADIQLADGSSGIDTVSQILAERTVPTIFITAFPERLLTGERPEPTFMITKPFQPATVEAAIAQALFFNSTAHADA
jgi:CheY-like chemotaxis protein/DNA-directed RNA polymerase specialized sigma24 family protein